MSFATHIRSLGATLSGSSALGGVARMAIMELIELVAQLVEARGLEGAQKLMRQMIETPASKADIDSNEAEVQSILNQRRADEESP